MVRPSRVPLAPPPRGGDTKNATPEGVALIGKKCVDLFEGSFGFRNCLGDTGNDLVRVAL